MRSTAGAADAEYAMRSPTYIHREGAIARRPSPPPPSLLLAGERFAPSANKNAQSRSIILLPTGRSAFFLAAPPNFGGHRRGWILVRRVLYRSDCYWQRFEEYPGLERMNFH
jgi:hypothetical protein